MDKKIIATGAVLGFTAIILEASGAHALKKVLDASQLAAFETGARYQMYHALFLLFIGTAAYISDKAKKAIWYLCSFGVLFFSGSIYLLATESVSNIDFRAIGFITPIGGVLLIAAWGLLFLNILKKKA